MGNSIHIQLKEAVELFEKMNSLSKAKERESIANVLREKFVKDFPKESLEKMSLSDYLIAKEGYGNSESFCRRIRHKLEAIAHMGNSRYDVFGIYYSDGTQLKMSRTFEKKFGKDFDEAFIYIKKEILKLFDEVEKGNFDFVDKCELNSLFVYKLLMIYYPNIFFPICTKTKLDECMMRIGIAGDENTRMVYKNLKLAQWKSAYAEVSKWSNSIVMSFCFWLRERDYIIDYDPHVEKLHQIEEIDNEISKYSTLGISKEAIVKIRVNQGVFREQLFKRYNKCCLCGVKEKSLLFASHIKPWSKCEAEEKLDVNNGLLLCPNHDQLFDKGWISFDDEGNILISPLLLNEETIWLNVHKDMKLTVINENKKFLSYHRKKIFRKGE